MLRSHSAPHLARSKSSFRVPTAKFLSRRQASFWGFVILWALYLSYSASRAPLQSVSQRSRSLLEASSVKGRLDAIDFGKQPLQSLRAIVQRAISPGFKEWAAETGDAQGDGEYDPVFKHVESVATHLSNLEKQVSCPWDPTLEADLPLLKGQKYLIAANFRNNEDLLPHLIVQLWHLLAILPQGSAFVSVYESGSTDSTGAWLEILRQLVVAMQVPHRIATGGNLTRADDQDRIDFLAQVRNAALEPLWLKSTSESGTANTWFDARGLRAEVLWPADKVIFLNDVYFCARDAVRLLLHGADMACGMDFDRKKLDQVPIKDQRRKLAEYMQSRTHVPYFVGYLISRIRQLREQHSKSEKAIEYFRRDVSMGFYDLWVGRDANGNLFNKEAPYATDPYSLQRLPNGLPFPVKCCWNGLIALNARPFTRHGLRMRAHKEGECAASECSLLCNDFLRLGYQNLIVDPGVRQAYSIKDAMDLYNQDWVKGIKVSLWAEVTQAPPVDWKLVPFRPFAQCCGLKPGNNMVEFEKDCDWENIMYPNYTAMPQPAEGRHVNVTAVSQKVYG